MVGYFDVAAGLTFSFDNGRDGMVAAIKGTLISEKAISLGGNPGRELKISATGNDGTEYIVRARFYQVGSRGLRGATDRRQVGGGPIADAKSVKYFDSFQVTKPH